MDIPFTEEVELLKLIEITSFGGSFSLSTEDCHNDMIVGQPDNRHFQDSKE